MLIKVFRIKGNILNRDTHARAGEFVRIRAYLFPFPLNLLIAELFL